MSDQELLARVMRILEDVKYGQRRIIPAACDIVDLFAAPSPGTGGGAKPCETCKGAREVLRLYNRGSSSPPGNQMIPCPTCRPVSRATPEKGGVK